jgi:hypothetical protein
MKIKLWKKNIFITGALLSFFFLGGLSIARADSKPNSLFICGTNTQANGEYIKMVEEEGTAIYNFNGGGLTITDYGATFELILGKNVGFPPTPIFEYYMITDYPFALPITITNTGEDTITVNLTACEITPPEENNNLVGGYFFKTPPASSLGAGVGTVSTDVMTGLLPYIYVVGGLYVGFWLVNKILALIPKDNTMEKADKEIARSERLIKEEKRIIASLD